MADSGEGKSEKACGQGEGSESEYVKLVSGDGHEFILKRKYAVISEYVKKRLTCEDPGVQNKVVIDNIASLVLQKVCTFLIYQYKLADDASRKNKAGPANTSKEIEGEFADPPEDLEDFPIPPALAVSVLQAANVLEC